MTENPQQMVIEGLEMSEDYVSRLVLGMQELLQLVRSGREAEAKALFMDTTEGLEWYTTILLGVITIFPESKIKALQGKTIETSVNETIEQTMQMAAAMENGDMVFFGDILEYEVIPWLQYWSEVAPEMTLLVKAI